MWQTITFLLLNSSAEVSGIHPMHVVVISWTGGNVICLNLGHTELMSGAGLEQEVVQALEAVGPAGGWCDLLHHPWEQIKLWDRENPKSLSLGVSVICEPSCQLLSPSPFPPLGAERGVGQAWDHHPHENTAGVQEGGARKTVENLMAKLKRTAKAELQDWRNGSVLKKGLWRDRCSSPETSLSTADE